MSRCEHTRRLAQTELRVPWCYVLQTTGILLCLSGTRVLSRRALHVVQLLQHRSQYGFCHQIPSSPGNSIPNTLSNPVIGRFSLRENKFLNRRRPHPGHGLSFACTLAAWKPLLVTTTKQLGGKRLLLQGREPVERQAEKGTCWDLQRMSGQVASKSKQPKRYFQREDKRGGSWEMCGSCS